MGRGSARRLPFQRWRVRATKRQVAIKKINNVFDHVSDATRILREIKLLRLLKHPGAFGLALGPARGRRGGAPSSAAAIERRFGAHLGGWRRREQAPRPSSRFLRRAAAALRRPGRAQRRLSPPLAPHSTSPAPVAASHQHQRLAESPERHCPPPPRRAPPFHPPPPP
jgi:serine/threonine protein kinase